MHIVMSGSSGLVGSWLRADLESAGCRVVRLVRSREQADAPDCALWNPAEGELDPSLVSGADAVVNLNGRNISSGRWTDTVKDELRSSRLQATTTLAEAIDAADDPPRLLLNASATGYYGDRGDDVLTEEAPPADDFLGRLSRDWEEAATAAESDRTRVVRLRFGIILARDGGALERMLTPFRLGLGGPLGPGSQWWSWVAIQDVVGVIKFLLESDTASGAYNVVSPEPVRCKEFVRTLGDVLNRPAVLPAPSFALRLALGEMADALLLASTRVEPQALARAGYGFRAPDLGQALRDLLA